MRTLLLCLMIVCGVRFAQPQDNSPLTPDEGRLILGQLGELNSCREETAFLKKMIERDAEQDERERQTSGRELQLEKQATELAQKERDLAAERADFYKGLYDAIKKGPGFWCKMRRFFSFGLARCQ